MDCENDYQDLGQPKVGPNTVGTPILVQKFAKELDLPISKKKKPKFLGSHTQNYDRQAVGLQPKLKTSKTLVMYKDNSHLRMIKNSTNSGTKRDSNGIELTPKFEQQKANAEETRKMVAARRARSVIHREKNTQLAHVTF